MCTFLLPFAWELDRALPITKEVRCCQIARGSRIISVALLLARFRTVFGKYSQDFVAEFAKLAYHPGKHADTDANIALPRHNPQRFAYAQFAGKRPVAQLQRALSVDKRFQ
jgi:hypothetical protein